MASVNIVMNLLFLPQFCVIAVAWATLAAFTTSALVSWAVAKSMFALPALRNVYWRSASASAIMIVVLYLLPSPPGFFWLLAKFAVGFITYVCMAWALDIANCRKLFKS